MTHRLIVPVFALIEKLRTRLARAVLCCAVWQAALAAQPYTDLLLQPILPEAQRRSMMYSFVDRNLLPIEAPGTRKAWEANRGQLRAEILRIVGLHDLAGRGRLHWQDRGHIDRQQYTIDKIVYESYPGMWVPALAYVPKGLRGPAPAMVSIPGHIYCAGKASLDAQARAANLAMRGIIVLTYDYINTFERNTGVDPCALMPAGGGNDHGNRLFSYVDRTPTGLEILDGVRAVDYLWERADVDRSRIGLTGESGGSNTTYWVAALDERVRLAVPVASVTSFDYWIRLDRNWDWHQRPHGIRRVADIWTLLALVAPRPLLVIASLRGTDSQEFPYDEAEHAVERARGVYGLYGREQDIGLWESTTSHGYQQDKRERMYAWVERHFLGRKGERSAELPFVFEPQDKLRCGLPEGNMTLAAIYREWLDKRAATIAPGGDRLAELLGMPKRAGAVLNVQSVASRGDTVVRQLIVRGEAGIDLPAVEVAPRTAPVGVVIVPGRDEEASRRLPALLAQGLAAVVFDPRGTGEIESCGGRTDNWAWFVGRPWPGMWAADIITVVTALKSPRGPVGVWASGRFAKAAVFAAALDSHIAALHVRLPETGWRREAERGLPADVPGILSLGDMPQIAALVAPRPCTLELLHPGDAYRFTEATYERASARPMLRIAAGQEAPEQTAAWFRAQLR